MGMKREIAKRIKEAFGENEELGSFPPEAIEALTLGAALAFKHESPLVADDGMYEAFYLAHLFVEEVLYRFLWTGEFRDALGQLESPIERKFLYGFLHFTTGCRTEVWFHGARSWVRLDNYTSEAEYYRIVPQWAYAGKRVDFLLEHGVHVDFVEAGQRRIPRYAKSFLLVECDGHEFHERTKEQAARDRKRDREWVAAEIRCVRFTGSEIHRNAYACARECVHLLGDAHNKEKKEDPSPIDLPPESSTEQEDGGQHQENVGG